MNIYFRYYWSLAVIILFTQCNNSPYSSRENFKPKFPQQDFIADTSSEPVYDENAIVDESDYNIFSKTGFGAFSIAYPKNWTLVENPNKYICATFTEINSEYEFKNNINIIVSNNAKSVDALFTQKSEKQMREVFPDYMIKSKTRTEFKNRECLMILSEFTSNETPVIQQQFFFKSSDNAAYVLTFTYRSISHEGEKETINQIINSFKFK